MASNKKVKERSANRKKKSDDKFTKLLTDVDKVLSTGDVVNHRVARGQAFTTGKRTQ